MGGGASASGYLTYLLPLGEGGRESKYLKLLYILTPPPSPTHTALGGRVNGRDGP